MRLRSVSSGLFTGIPSLRRTIRLFQTLNEAKRIGVLNSYPLTMITVNGLVQNAHRNEIQSEITLDDLFRAAG